MSVLVQIKRTKLYSVFEDSLSNKASSAPSATPSAPTVQPQETFSRKLVLPDKEVLLDFAVVRLDQSCFCWCGVNTGTAPQLNSLVVAMTGGKSGPVATSVLGAKVSTNEDEASAMRIARRTKMVMIHFSSSFGSENTQEVRMFAEKTLVEALIGGSA